MTSPFASAAAPFGRVLTAMVTPFDSNGQLDLAAAQKLASHLVDLGNDGIVVSGTTGESPTTTGAEDGLLLSAVLEAVGDRATVVAGVGTNDTRHTVELADQAARLGAHGLLVVTPYYNKPPQAGIIANIDAVLAVSGDVPVMLYDIVGRTGVQIAESSFDELQSRDSVLAIKDASGDLARGSRLLANTRFALYSGDDALNLPWLSIGAVGVVSVIGHLVADRIRDMVSAVDAGDLAAARTLDASMHGLLAAVMGQTQGAIAAKTALAEIGILDNPLVRLPLTPMTEDHRAALVAALQEAGLLA